LNYGRIDEGAKRLDVHRLVQKPVGAIAGSRTFPQDAPKAKIVTRWRPGRAAVLPPLAENFPTKRGRFRCQKFRPAKDDQSDGSQAIPVGVVVRLFFVHYFEALVSDQSRPQGTTP